MSRDKLYVDTCIVIDYGRGEEYARHCIEKLKANHELVISPYTMLETLAVITRVTQFSKLPRDIGRIVSDPRDQAVLWLLTFVKKLGAKILGEIKGELRDPRLGVEMLRLYVETIDTMLNLVGMHRVGTGDLIHLTYMRKHGINKLVTADRKFVETARRVRIEVVECIDRAEHDSHANRATHRPAPQNRFNTQEA